MIESQDNDKIQLVVRVDRSDYYRIINGFADEDDAAMFKHLFENGVKLPEGCDTQRIVPKRVDVQRWIYTKCPNPNCDYVLSKHHGDGYYSIEHKYHFCPNCGQALLWESEE